MKIIFGGCKSGKSHKLLKLFLEDRNTASFITDELTLDDIINKINQLKNEEIIDVVDIEGKEIKTNMSVSLDSQYYYMVNELMGNSLYLDLHIPKEFRKSFKTFCLGIEKDYGKNITLIEQVPSSSDIDNGLRIVEYNEIKDL